MHFLQSWQVVLHQCMALMLAQVAVFIVMDIVTEEELEVWSNLSEVLENYVRLKISNFLAELTVKPQLNRLKCNQSRQIELTCLFPGGLLIL